MKQRLWKMFAVGLLVVCTALVGLWIRSAYAGDVLYVRTAWWEYQIRSDWGRVSVTALATEGVGPEVHWERNSGGFAGSWPGVAKRQHNLGIIHLRAGTPFRSTLPYYGVETYHPVIIALVALPLVPWAVGPLRKWNAAKRRRIGLCVRCGYDVRASSDRCPECGERVVGAAASACRA